MQQHCAPAIAIDIALIAHEPRARLNRPGGCSCAAGYQKSYASITQFLVKNRPPPGSRSATPLRCVSPPLSRRHRPFRHLLRLAAAASPPPLQACSLIKRPNRVLVLAPAILPIWPNRLRPAAPIGPRWFLAGRGARPPARWQSVTHGSFIARFRHVREGACGLNSGLGRKQSALIGRTIAESAAETKSSVTRRLPIRSTNGRRVRARPAVAERIGARNCTSGAVLREIMRLDTHFWARRAWVDCRKLS